MQKLIKIIFATLSLMLLTLPNTLVRAQTPELDKIQKSDKNLVSVPVTVSDREGRYIADLKKEDFTVFQDGVKQNIAYFATYDEPLNIALLLDTSGSTTDSLDKIKDAAQDFIDLLNPDDKCLIATFDARIKVLNSLTNDPEILKKSLGKVETAQQDGTLLHNAVQQIAQNAFTKAPGRKVIIILSDGKDFGSSLTKTGLMKLLEESDVLIYSVYYNTGEGFSKLVITPTGQVMEGKTDAKPKKIKAPKKSKVYSVGIPAPENLPTDEQIAVREKAADIEAVNSLKEMSDATAGRFYLSDAPNLRGIFKQIAGELRQQYWLGYHSKDALSSTAVHDINVKVARTDAVVRARGKFRAKQL